MDSRYLRSFLDVITICLFVLSSVSNVVSYAIIDIHRARVREDSEFVYLENDFMEIVLSKNLNGKIYSIINKNSGIDIIQLKDAWGWILGLVLQNDKGEKIVTGPGAQNEFWHSIDNTENGVNLNLYWKDFNLGGGKYLMAMIHIMITLYDNSYLSYWSLDIDLPEGLAIIDFTCPVLSGITSVGNSPEDDYLVTPTQKGGWLISNPYSNFVRNHTGLWVDNLYPSYIPVQFLTLYDGSGGLYLATYDNRCYT